jgi:hypothetical protein
MASKDNIQFQEGISLRVFLQKYSTEDAPSVSML